MIASMTGYGKSIYSDPNFKITVEIKSVNSKQLDLLMRMPAVFREQETTIRNRISPILERGKIELTVNYENLRGVSPVKINKAIIKEYKRLIDDISEELQIEAPKDWVQVLFRMPDSLTTSTPEADENENEALIRTILAASDNFMQYRLQEGKSLYEFFFQKIERIREYLILTEKYEVDRVSKIREKLEQQLARLQGVEIDRGRLEQELIFYIEKLDVTEEKTRLRSHLNYFEETLGEPDETNISGKGKKLGFISQEIGREINTLGSKANDADMQKLVVMMKDELEQIKEQVLNVL
ncbi:MAG: YicC family protein [Muribaculaceae bacterium]|nr:YicC family protein [Muribaculaceae bacterium]